MEVDQSTYLLDLPDEVLEKIVFYLPFLVVRKNFRSTCKRLYYLYSREKRFHCDEVIVWSPKSKFAIAPFYQNSARSCFNLIFSGVTLNVQHVSRFFTEHGAKVQSLSFINCKSAPGFLESIIVQCEALCSLSIKCVNACPFSFESEVVTRPTVTSLELVLNSLISQRSDFLRIQHLFPCVQHLSVEVDEKSRDSVSFWTIFDFVVSFSQLKSLKLNVKEYPTSYLDDAKFMDLVPQLEKVYLSLESRYAECNSFLSFFASRSKASSIEIHESDVAYDWNMESVLSITTLKHLSYSAYELQFTAHAFDLLVSLQLETISFRATKIMLYADLPSSKVNKTVSDLTIHVNCDYFTSRVISLFVIHFRGLVHLKMGTVSNAILHEIFKHQKNLRSLVLQNCRDCTVDGFCGVNVNDSMENLRNLEHLSIEQIDPSVLRIQIVQRAFEFPRLEYLRISLASPNRSYESTEMEIPVDMLKSCVNLEALHLGQFSIPSSTTLSSLFQDLKRLNYLHFFISKPKRVRNYSPPVGRSPCECTYVNLKHFPMADLAKLLSNRNAKAYHYDEELDLTVFTEKLERTVSLTSPKFGYSTVDWINVK